MIIPLAIQIAEKNGYIKYRTEHLSEAGVILDLNFWQCLFPDCHKPFIHSDKIIRHIFTGGPILSFEEIWMQELASHGLIPGFLKINSYCIYYTRPDKGQVLHPDKEPKKL